MKIKPLYKRFLFVTKYYLVLIRYYLWFHFALLGKQPLLVYQMGKVGSKTIIASLKVSHLKMAIFHVHFLSKRGIGWVEELYTERSRQNFLKLGLPGSKRALPNHVLTSQHLSRLINKRTDISKWKIITIVREPVARNVSQYFNWIDIYYPEVYRQYLNGTLDCIQITENFLNEFGVGTKLGEMPLKWLDEELKQVFNIDVFASGFPKSKGYKIYSGDYAEVLLLKLETIKHCAPEAIKQFLGVDNLVLTDANSADEKIYYPIYREYLKKVTLPKSYLNKMYKSKYARHFYSSNEIKKLKAKWGRNMVKSDTIR